MIAELDERPALRDDDMDICGDLFGIRFVGDQVELYVEDDGWWHFKENFHSIWLRDLEQVAKVAADKRE